MTTDPTPTPSPFDQDLAEAHRRAADMLLTLAVEGDQGGFERQLARLATDEDALFSSFVAGVAIALLSGFLRKQYPVDERRKIAFTLLELHSSVDLGDLEQLLLADETRGTS